MPLAFGSGSLACFGLRQAGILASPEELPSASVELGPSSPPGDLPEATPWPAISLSPSNVATVDPQVRMETRLTILNGTKRTGLGTEAANILRQEGWTVWVVGNATRRDLAQTEVVVVHGKPALVLPLMEGLRVPGKQATRAEGDPSTDFTIILGEDFTDALRQRRLRPNAR